MVEIEAPPHMTRAQLLEAVATGGGEIAGAANIIDAIDGTWWSIARVRKNCDQDGNLNDANQIAVNDCLGLIAGWYRQLGICAESKPG